MKKIIKPLVIVIVFISAIAATILGLAEKPHPKVVLTENTQKRPVEIFPHAFQCSRCKMDIAIKEFSAQIVGESGKTWFFDDIGCMVLWLTDKPFRNSATIWVYALDTKRWIDGRNAFYSTTETTPMHYGFGAYENRKSDTIRIEAVTERISNGE